MVVVDANRGMCEEVKFIMEQIREEKLMGRLVLNKVLYHRSLTSSRYVWFRRTC